MGLRRVENAEMYFQDGRWGRGHGVLILSSRESVSWKCKYTEFASLWEDSYRSPALIYRRGPRQYWAFRGQYFVDTDALRARDVYALVVTRKQRSDRQLSRAHEMAAMGGPRQPSRRGAIPKDVKQYVWMRDGGRCTYCGSTTELQYDHVIPVARGGSSSEENLQILCGPCNRRKSSGIAMV